MAAVPASNPTTFLAVTLYLKRLYLVSHYYNLNNPIQLIFEDVVSLLDVCQLIAVGDQRGGIDLSLFNVSQSFHGVYPRFV